MVVVRKYLTREWYFRADGIIAQENALTSYVNDKQMVGLEIFVNKGEEKLKYSRRKWLYSKYNLIEYLQLNRYFDIELIKIRK